MAVLVTGAVLVTAGCGAAVTPMAATTSAPAAQSTTAVVAPTAPAFIPAGVGLIKGPFAGEAPTLNGAGATFPAVLYSKWFDEYSRLSNVKVNYQAIGSGGGIKGLQDATVDFGATDGPMSDAQLKAATRRNVLRIPMTLGAVVLTYSIPEAKSALKFSGDTIAAIYQGDIQKWNDARLVADNTDLRTWTSTSWSSIAQTAAAQRLPSPTTCRR